VSKPSPITTDADHVEQGFMDSRAKVIDVAAFLDRVQRAGQESDYRVVALRKALQVVLDGAEPRRAGDVLLSLSDLSEKPIATAHEKGASGAYQVAP